jgi:hypothetical protein
MTRLRHAPAAKGAAFERPGMNAQIAIGQDVTFKFLNDFLASSIPVDNERIVPHALGDFEPGNCTPDVDPLAADDDFAILLDGGIARSNMLAMKVDESCVHDFLARKRRKSSSFPLTSRSFKKSKSKDRLWV